MPIYGSQGVKVEAYGLYDDMMPTTSSLSQFLVQDLLNYPDGVHDLVGEALRLKQALIVETGNVKLSRTDQLTYLLTVHGS